MKPKDWGRVEEIFQAAYDLSAEERTVYLAQVCSENAPLRREVETLFSALEKRDGFLERSAFSQGLQAIAEDFREESLVGERLGRYQIRSLLGKGGMGKVFLADDDFLKRKAALKFLSGQFVNDAWSKRQLMKEAQAVACLNHPNICAVYGFEGVDGHSFMAMEYVEGETLDVYLHEHFLDMEQIVALARQICAALAEAHAHGLIHRDIKPQNIMVTSDGRAKILDFGLAKFVQQRQDFLENGVKSQNSDLGLVIGTIAYMSPEQLRAERLDFRTDLFSFGTLLHEMISGQNPFLRNSKAETISAILTADPPAPKRATSEPPVALARIVQKCLHRDREERYQSASEILLDLDHLKPDSAFYLPRRFFPGAWGIGLLVLFVSLILAAAYVYNERRGRQTLAVLPLITEDADSETRALGADITSRLIAQLSRTPKLRVAVSTATPTSAGQLPDLQNIGKSANAESVLVGRLRKRGDSLSIQFTLIKTADGGRVWAEERRVKPSQLELFQQELTVKIAFLLKLSLSEEGRMLLRALAASQSKDPNAYELYLQGRYYWNVRTRENIQRAIDCFEQAIELDPTFALAYVGLADSYVLMSTVAYGRPLPTKDAMNKAKAAARKALEIDDTLAEAHTSLGVYLLRYEWNWQEAEKEFTRAISSDGDYAPAHYWYSFLLSLTGRSDKSIAEGETARDLEPFSPHNEINLARALHYARRFDEAASILTKILERYPRQLSALNVLGYIYHQQGRWRESIELFEQLYEGDKLFGAAPLGYAYAKAGRVEDARNILNELELTSQQDDRPLFQEKAIIHFGLGEKDQAFQLLQESCNERFATFPFLLIEPFLDDQRSDPKFRELVRCARLPI